MSPLELYGCMALICAASAIVGWATLVLAGWREWSWLAPGLGLAELVILGGVTVYLPGRGVATTVAVCAAVGASGLVWIRHPPRLRPLWRPGLAVAIVIALAASLPFAAGGGFEILGTYVNNDLAFHIYDVEWLRTEQGIEPQHISDGYPLGPHGVVLALSAVTGAGLPAAWTGLLFAVAVLTGWASLTALGELRPLPRTLGALLVALSYLGASFLVQSAFKETTMALFALGFALALREAAAEGPRAKRTASGARRAAIPAAAFALASPLVYSLPGLAWPAATVAIWAGLRLWWRREKWSLRAELRRRRWLLPAAALAVVVGAIGAFAAWDRAADLIGGKELTGESATANLFAPIPPYEVLGIGLSNDYRIYAPTDAYASMLALLGAAALALGALRLARGRELALLAGLAAGGVAYLAGRYSIGPYAGSKGLAVAAPLVMLVALVGVVPGSEDRNAWWRRGRLALLIALGAVALISSYLALAGARLDHDDHLEQLGELRAEVQGQRVLFLGSDEYAAWALRGASVLSPKATTLGLYVSQDRPSGARTGERLDFDSVTSAVLDTMDYVITTRSGFASEPPPEFSKVDETESFVLWERTRPLEPTYTLREGEMPGNVLDCESEEGRALSRQRGTANVFVREPRFAHFGVAAFLAVGAPIWLKEDAGGAIDELPASARDEPATTTLQLPPGRWELSLQYHSLEPLLVDVAGLLRRELPPNSARIGPYWPLGTVAVDQPTSAEVSVDVVERPRLRRLLGGPAAFRLGPESLVGGLAAVPPGSNHELVPLSEACGRLVDWYVVEP